MNNQAQQTCWLSVETPQFFAEREFPCDEGQWTRADRAAYRKLEDKAETLGTYINSTPYRRG